MLWGIRKFMEWYALENKKVQEWYAMGNKKVHGMVCYRK